MDTTTKYSEEVKNKYRALLEKRKNAHAQRMIVRNHLDDTIADLEGWKKIAEKPAGKFIKLAWNLFWYGICIAIQKDATSAEMKAKSDWLKRYWEAKEEFIEGLQEKVERLKIELAEAEQDWKNACCDVESYERIYQGIEEQVS